MSAITIPDVLGRFIVTTLTFEEPVILDGKELDAANSPYAIIGLTISNAVERWLRHPGSNAHFSPNAADSHLVSRVG